MRYILLAFGLMVLLAGCTGTTPAGNQSQAAPPAPQPPAQNQTAPPPSCTEYCQSQPHAECAGSWKISGTYPNCVCTYECAVQENNTTAQPAPQPEPFATPTNRTISGMLYDSLGKASTQFYKEHDGVFSERNYTWLREGDGGGGITFDKAPATDIRFDGQAIDSIAAFGYIVFEDKSGGSPVAYGAAIFKAKSTVLDGYTGSDAFDVDYFPSQKDGLLGDCWAYSKDYNVDQQDQWIITYNLRCERVSDK
jgi:hypothetical protein